MRAGEPGDESNRRVYLRRSMAAHYARRSRLLPDESAILTRLTGRVKGANILDLGVGGGRTTSALLELAGTYVGADFAPRMIAECRARFPGVQFEVADARDLSRFAVGAFDFVLFSNNGIDTVAHADRMAILTQVHRVLAGRGLFVFSSHNREFAIPRPWSLKHFRSKARQRPLNLARQIGSLALGCVNYGRHLRQQRATSEYCISVDSAHHYSLLHYRIAPAAQQAQLERRGFRLLEVAGVDGRVLSSADWDEASDPWFNYICERVE